MRVLLACERSAGHIFPALGFAKKLSEEFQVYFFVSSPFLKKYIEKQGFSCLGRSFKFRNFMVEGVWRLIEALYLILKIKPKKVIGFGGRDSFFLVLFSSFLKLKTAIYEPNLKLGRANRLLVPFVGEVLRGFEVTGRKGRTIGIPLRENIKIIDKRKARRILDFNDQPVVFCLGGSQGSSFINQTFIKFIRNYQGNYQVIHLTGKAEYSKILSLYKKIKNRSFVKDFYYDIEILYSAADLVVSRAGAVTLAEISFYGLPAILLPHPGGGGHQEENALFLERIDAAMVHLQSGFSFDDFSCSLNKLIEDASLRQKLKDNLNKIKLGVSYENFDSSAYS
ncbi:MAG: UDP-N-acetylglucosamine--N-acetylmuramyl-(pentapeptide) pyrophosphoryl-undecaprenol N-acetylglucosamine transferase [Candidatus Omnitrophota bacterium]